MKSLLSAFFHGLRLSTVPVTPAVAYFMDCAIFFCLAGGWLQVAESFSDLAEFFVPTRPTVYRSLYRVGVPSRTFALMSVVCHR